jgi:hypothetical protein
MKDLNKLALLMQIYTEAINISRANKQTVGEKNDYYVTLEQLEALLMRQK